MKTEGTVFSLETICLEKEKTRTLNSYELFDSDLKVPRKKKNFQSQKVLTRPWIIYLFMIQDRRDCSGEWKQTGLLDNSILRENQYIES